MTRDILEVLGCTRIEYDEPEPFLDMLNHENDWYVQETIVLGFIDNQEANNLIQASVKTQTA